MTHDLDKDAADIALRQSLEKLEAQIRDTIHDLGVDVRPFTVEYGTFHVEEPMEYADEVEGFEVLVQEFQGKLWVEEEEHRRLVQHLIRRLSTADEAMHELEPSARLACEAVRHGVLTFPQLEQILAAVTRATRFGVHPDQIIDSLVDGFVYPSAENPPGPVRSLIRKIRTLLRPGPA